MKFKKGDRVRVTSCDDDQGYVGKFATVRGEPQRSRILGAQVVPVELDGIGEEVFFSTELELIKDLTGIPLDADHMSDIVAAALDMWNTSGVPPLLIERCEGFMVVRVSNVKYRIDVKAVV
jgi:hypothetical protein